MNNEQRPISDSGFLQEIYPTTEDAGRCFGSLAKLSRHFQGPVVITGSIASGWHLIEHGRPVTRRPLNDIDTVAITGLAQIKPSITQDFLINHFHPSREKGKVLLQLVDGEYGTRIEVFTPSSHSLSERLTSCAVGDLSCSVISVEDAVAKLLSILYPVTEGTPVDPKYIEQLDLLLALANEENTKKVWREYRKEGQHLDFNEAVGIVKSCIAANPKLLESTRYCQDQNYLCAWCEESELFPLAPRSRIYEILGYV